MSEKLHDPIEGVTPDGIIVTGASQSRLSLEFLPILEAVKRRLPRCVSLYVYGSVANGTARSGESDVDLITVGLDAETARDLGATLSEEFSRLCRRVEIGPGQRTGYEGLDDESHGNRVLAAQRWGEITPSLSEDLATLVLWGDGQIQNVSEHEVRQMLYGTITKVVVDFSEKVGLWDV